MYTLTLNDGTKIEGLALDGNRLISSQPVTFSQLAGKLNPAVISGTKDESDSEDTLMMEGTHPHMEAAYIREINGKYYIALNDIPNEKWDIEQLKANQDFIAMMSGIQL